MNSEASLQALLDAISSRNAQTALTLADADPRLLGQRSAAGLSPLSLAAYMDQAELVAALRARREPDLFEALIVGDAEVVDRELAAGQDVNQLAPDGFTMLGLAVFFRHGALALRLLDAGADVDARADNAQRVAALHAAVARGDAAMVVTLLARGATVDLPQQQGVTPLHAAAGAGRADLVKLLREAGANPALKDEAGRDAAEHARQHGHTALAEALLRS
jgi:ankyrin repeat protein